MKGRDSPLFASLPHHLKTMQAALATKKPANGKKEDQNGPQTVKRMFSYPLTSKPLNEATERNLIKPMRQEGVEGRG